VINSRLQTERIYLSRKKMEMKDCI